MKTAEWDGHKHANEITGKLTGPEICIAGLP